LLPDDVRLEDTAAVLKMDALEFFLKNLQFTKRGEVYAEELKIAADNRL